VAEALRLRPAAAASLAWACEAEGQEGRMELSIVFPMFWGREKRQVYLEGDHFYDHPTALDDDGTIPQLFASMRILKDRDFDIIAVAGANHPSLAEAVERRAAELLADHAAKAGVRLHYFSYSHLKRLHDYLRELGKGDLTQAVSLVGYSPLRNACLVVAQILGRDIAVSIDDDCLFVEPDYIGRIKRAMLSDFEGGPIRALTGPYLTAKDSIFLDLPTAPHAAYWNVVQVMNSAFKQYIVDSPGRKEIPFAIMGNIAVHRDFYTRVPLDPPMQRGEDMDWVMNAHVLGERFVMDTELVIKHDPPPRPYPAWRPLREDIYRFRYQRAKIDHSWEGDGHHSLDANRYLPYPGAFFQDDFLERATQACTILAIDYLARGEAENAKESLNNIHHAHYLAAPKGNPYQDYLDFQRHWRDVMEVIGERRAEIQQRVFG
jgi:hypothetical protein